MNSTVNLINLIILFVFIRIFSFALKFYNPSFNLVLKFWSRTLLQWYNNGMRYKCCVFRYIACIHTYVKHFHLRMLNLHNTSFKCWMEYIPKYWTAWMQFILTFKCSVNTLQFKMAALSYKVSSTIMWGW